MYHNPAKSPIVVQPMVVFFFFPFFLSLFLFYLSVPIAPLSASPRYFSEFSTVSFRERTKSIIDRTGSWQIFRSSPISSSDLLEKREEQLDDAFACSICNADVYPQVMPFGFRYSHRVWRCARNLKLACLTSTT